MKKLIFIITTLFASALITAPAFANRPPICDHLEPGSQQFIVAGCEESGIVDDDGNPVPETLQNSPMVGAVVNIIFFVIGIISVVVLIYGGIRYMLAQGLAAELSQAQHTIIYGIVGLIISLAGWAIVRFVLANIFGS